MTTLFYITDPMCSWCYAFKTVLQQLREKLPEQVQLTTLLGGLAADTDQPMAIAMRQQLRATWQQIEQKVPQVRFNYDFWDPDINSSPPRRSTYPACRAVITAHTFDNASDNDHYYEQLMIEAIQAAYYQQARNPSDNTTLIALAGEIGLDQAEFKIQLLSNETQEELLRQIAICRQLNVNSYPSLVLKLGDDLWPISIDYNRTDPMLETIYSLLEFD